MAAVMEGSEGVMEGWVEGGGTGDKKGEGIGNEMYEVWMG